MPEIAAGKGFPYLALLGLKEHGISAIGLLGYYWRKAALLRHPRIVLRAPCDKVVGIGHGKAWGIIINLEYRHITALLECHDVGRVHALLGTPLRIV